MKNKTGKITGFITGMAGFLLIFKLAILDHTAPSDELAPGIVVIVSVFSGLACAWAGSLIQKNLKRTAHRKI
jgi:hypothetical protein